MYCPQCSQQQISDEMRFCSRCGFPLTPVRELIAGGGTLVEVEKEQLETRRAVALKGARKGALIMLASLPIAFIVAILSAINDGFAVLILIPFLAMVFGFFRMLYGIFCQSRPPRHKRDVEEPKVLAASTSATTVLKPEQFDRSGAPLELLHGRKTAEVIQPPSVTENTTRLLDED